MKTLVLESLKSSGLSLSKNELSLHIRDSQKKPIEGKHDASPVCRKFAFFYKQQLATYVPSNHPLV